MPEKPFPEIAEKILSRHGDLLTEETFDRLYRMIDYAIKRQDWYEDQRNKILSLAVALLGLSSFLVSGLLSAAVKDMWWFKIFAVFTLWSVVLTSLFVILEYAEGGQEKYTHRSLADIKSWFFAYVVKDITADAAKFDFKKDDQNKAILTNAWQEFLDGWIKIQTPDRRAAEDLQQVFVLYLFQAMRRKSLRSMLDHVRRGGLVIGFFLLPTIIFAALGI